MQNLEYKGYFENGLFYSSGKVVPIPEKRDVVIKILAEAANTRTKKQVAPSSKLRFDFIKEVPPLPDSFFDPLPEEELKLWE